MKSLRYTFLTLVFVGLTLALSSWNDGERRFDSGPLPPVPDYADSTQWFIINRGGEADLFYIISTETDDHMIGDDTCHFADTNDPALRKNMLREMVAVDSFYSGKLNYFSPYYRQLSMDFAAYVIGFKVTQEDVDSNKNIKLAQDSTDTGVLIAFNSVKSPESIIYFTENNVACINPVSWRMDTDPTPFVLYGRRQNDTLSVRCDTVSHHLMVEGITKHRPMPVIGKPGNYHNMELKLYYPYVRKNMADRVAAFMAKKKEE